MNVYSFGTVLSVQNLFNIQVDRCPTGSGVTARIAVQYARQQIGLHQLRVFEQGLVGSKFTAQAVKDTKCGDFDAVHVEVAGHAYYTGKCTFSVEKDDPFREGFLLKWMSSKTLQVHYVI